MKTILNKTTRPMRVPLPRGKVLHLSPRKSGEIADKAVEHPPLARLVEAGDLEVVGDGNHGDARKASSSGAPNASNQDHHSAVNTHRRGDR